MKFIKKDSLSISECCELLNIKKENLPDALQKINEPKDIIDIFKNLLYEDKKAFESCSTIEEYKKYIAKWPDGLHKDKATQKISQLKEEAEELACYRKNKIKISCDRNYKDPPREGNVYVECGNKRIAITIVQDGWENCSRCGGFKELDCPNLYVLPWTTEFGVYTYMWDNNGRHILRRGYTEWNPYGGPPIPKTTDSECLKCKGDGKIECPKCNGKGKTKKNY